MSLPSGPLPGMGHAPSPTWYSPGGLDSGAPYIVHRIATYGRTLPFTLDEHQENF